VRRRADRAPAHQNVIFDLAAPGAEGGGGSTGHFGNFVKFRQHARIEQSEYGVLQELHDSRTAARRQPARGRNRALYHDMANA
jgi:hypothetical protein